MRVRMDRTCTHSDWSTMGQVPDKDMFQCTVCSAYFTGPELETMNRLSLDSDNRVGLVYDLFEAGKISEVSKMEFLMALEGVVLYKNHYPFRPTASQIESTNFVVDDSDVREYTPVIIPGGVGSEEKTFLVSETGGRKEVKEARYSLVPTEALRVLSEIYGRGAAKYAPHNWRKGYDWSASLDALQRHVSAFWAGDEIDPESGQPHILHAAWHCFTLYTFSTEPDYARFDDRWRGGSGGTESDNGD